ncbi:MAG TPA: proton-conducting transporter membrane subunit [Gammaproteobacteria bacterium]|nr:proton-conducting transporter membrane subunit [Gammaproteobacteria bacterium]
MEPVTAVLGPAAAGALLALAVAVPLALLPALGVPAFRRAALGLAPWAGLAALAAGLLVPAATTVELPWVLTGMRLGLDGIGRPFLLLTGVLWPAAGIFARATLEPSVHVRFTGFSLAALAGTVGICLAAEPATFYSFYAVMGLAIYGLVWGDGAPPNRRAANIYLGFTVAGEGALLAALLVGVAEGALSGPWGMGLAVAALGIKLGLVPLHTWMPLAYGAAPLAAGALLGGAMVNAGLIGWLRFLPLGTAALPGWGEILLVLGTLAAFGGVLVGLGQRHPGAVLGYSSISQMGWITVAVGTALTAPGGWDAGLEWVVMAYAVHHGLVKGGLFLTLGLLRRPAAWLGWAALAVLALVLAGAPGTGGAAVKLALKHALGELPGADPGAVKVLLGAGAAATTLLLARLLVLVRTEPGLPPLGRAAVVAALVPVGLAGALPWLWPGLRPEVLASLGPQAAVTAGPVAGAALLAVLVAWLGRGRDWFGPLALPPGDMLWLAEALARRLAPAVAWRWAAARAWWVPANRLGEGLRAHLWQPLRGRLSAADRWGWTASGLALLLLLGAMAVSLLG